MPLEHTRVRDGVRALPVRVKGLDGNRIECERCWSVRRKVRRIRARTFYVHVVSEGKRLVPVCEKCRTELLSIEAEAEFAVLRRNLRQYLVQSVMSR